MKKNNLKVSVALVCYQEKEEMIYLLEDLKKQTALNNIGEVLIFKMEIANKHKK